MREVSLDASEVRSFWPCKCSSIIDIMTWKGFLHYWPLVRGIRRSPSLWNFWFSHIVTLIKPFISSRAVVIWCQCHMSCFVCSSQEDVVSACMVCIEQDLAQGAVVMVTGHGTHYVDTPLKKTAFPWQELLLLFLFFIRWYQNMCASRRHGYVKAGSFQ